MNLKERAAQIKKQQLGFLAGWLIVLLAAVLAYWPGLNGPYLLDDFGSIAVLGDYGGVTNWETFKRFVFGGHSGPTGRPISLLSFLIDANNWPADSLPFKRTNLVIHLINGILLGVLTTMVLKCLEVSERGVRWIALVATAMWILHPFLVSTTLYIVQRMAQLSTLFMFAGLALYLYGRLQIAENTKKAYLIMTAAIGVFTLLAMLSKENGILLPLLVGVIELTVVASQRHRLPALNRYWMSVCIILPAAVVGLYLARLLLAESFFDILPPRDFSVYERFLTQGRVLIEYLQHWYIPKLYTTGIFQDHFIKSTGLFVPVTTALSHLLHVAVIGLALAKRRQYPLFSLAVLFFYGSHLLESTVVNLELYFEHRNYPATAFLFLPLVEWLYRKASPRTFGIVSLAVVLLLTSFTRYSATVWASLPSMIETSALKAPTSARAQSQYAKLLFISGRRSEAIAVIEEAIEKLPADPLLLLSRLYFLCGENVLDAREFERVAHTLLQLPFDSRALKAYNVFAEAVVLGSCPNVENERLESLFVRMLDVSPNGNPTSLAYSHIQFLIGYTRVFLDRPGEAVEAFEKSLDSRPGPSHAMAMASLLASRDFGGEALILADRALVQLQREMAEDPLLVPKVSESDILEFQKAVNADLAVQQGGDISDPAQ
ncbi:MAG: hypothetical protein GWP62_11385 [Gammaproteobacteria bacterium]|jgi:tetratricopeptide (TPR) repeat protein|nr:hypothetical protein [Gammaproteobacteria bacterium]